MQLAVWRITFKLNDLWPKYLACWSILTPYRPGLMVKVIGQSSGWHGRGNLQKEKYFWLQMEVMRWDKRMVSWSGNCKSCIFQIYNKYVLTSWYWQLILFTLNLLPVGVIIMAICNVILETLYVAEYRSSQKNTQNPDTTFWTQTNNKCCLNHSAFWNKGVAFWEDLLHFSNL